MAGKRKLGTHVVLSHEGDIVNLGPDDEVPGWAVEQIGDHCWADGGDDDVDPAGGDEGRVRAAVDDDLAGDDDGGDDEAPKAPRRSRR